MATATDMRDAALSWFTKYGMNDYRRSVVSKWNAADWQVVLQTHYTKLGWELKPVYFESERAKALELLREAGTSVPVKESAGMDELQQQVFNYLTVPGKPERRDALNKLIDGGWFLQSDSESARKFLPDWLDMWEKDGTFCKAGIDRARKHFGLKLPTAHKVRIVLEMDVAVCSKAGELGKSANGNYDATDGFGKIGTDLVFGLDWALTNALDDVIILGPGKNANATLNQPIKILKAHTVKAEVIA